MDDYTDNNCKMKMIIMETRLDYCGFVTCICLVYLTEYRHPVRTSDVFPITVLGKNWLLYIWTSQKVAKKVVYDLGYAVKNITVRDPLMIIGCGCGDCEFIAFVAVPLRYRPFGTGEGTHPG